MNVFPIRFSFRPWLTLTLFVFATAIGAISARAAAPLKVLFLGDSGLHQPATRLRDLAPAMIARGVQLVYTEDLSSLNLEELKRYDALFIYANVTTLSPAQEQALVDYVTQGGGLFALHSASACFGNSDRYIALVGGRFKSHGTGDVHTRIAVPDHPVMQGFKGFVSWDETYVHDRQNEQGRTVLEFRDDEPWTWVRSEGKGHVFYTAWGHDERTWTNPGFQELVERGLRFAAGQKLPDALAKGPAVAAFEYIDQKVPYYSNLPGSAPQGANDWPRTQKPLTAAQSMEHIIVPGGFEVQLFASDPEIKKPISMSWDERGRLWIIETTDYPNRVLPAGEKGNDRIVICEDTNHDGKADKFTVFADGLNIPTSLTFANGGVVVQQMPNTIFLKDTDGDDKADIREVLITGWGRRDTHAGPNNLANGLDNWIWGMVGYSGFNGTVGGKAYNFSQAFYRFKPDGSALELLRGTNNNTWGLGFDETGVAFGSTANNNPSVYMPIPARYYEPAGLVAGTLGTIANTSRYLPVTTRVREVDVFWGYTAGAGHAVYTARSYPKEYWNRVAFVAEPTGHLVGQFILDSNGADFRSRNPTNLIASDDEWFAPIMAEVGPDGSVWVIDWYNYIIQHNPTPNGYANGAGNAYENPLRDKRYGRIYRVVWKDAKPSPQPNFHNAAPDQLVQGLSNDNLLWRRHAQRLLVERGRKDVVPALIALVKDQRVDEVGQNVGATHALWTLSGLQAIDSDPAALAVATEALRHPSPAVRRNAIAVLPHTAATATALVNAASLKDANGQVRLSALLALSEAPEVPVTGSALHEMLAAPSLTLDRWSADAAKMAATKQATSFLAAVTPDEMKTARAYQTQGTRALLNSASFRAGQSAIPTDWTLIKSAGEAEAKPATVSRTGTHSLRIDVRGDGAAAGASTKLKVKRNTRYELTGWIKTEGLPAAGGGRGGGGGGGGGRGAAAFGGALLTVPEVQMRGGPGGVVRGTSDWTQQRSPFTTTDVQDITVVCSVSLGTSATKSGTAWFDEISLNELGPADESVSDPLNVVVNYVATRTGLATKAAAVVENVPGTVVLNLSTIPDVMKFDRPELTVKAGQPVRIAFKNNDHMQHNVLILRPGTLEAVGLLADQMAADPKALARSYIPESPNVLFSLPLVNPGESSQMVFTAPTAPGRYPLICTFPGHWRIMQGVLIVTPAM